VTAGGNATVTINYTTKIGKYDIYFLVDPVILFNGSIIESNETNNIANRTIDISAYNIYYGNILSDILLDTSSNLTVFAWFNLSSFNGNVLAADSDSAVDFNALKALSRNLTSNLTFDDFAELDFALNITNVTGSVNRTYTYNGEIKDVMNFTLFDSLIENVPIANSTNTSNFVTGILWDTGDDATGDANGQYSGNEDVLFVTRVRKSTPGKYGTYDYEIRVPANLRKYIIPNLEDSVTFYREVT